MLANIIKRFCCMAESQVYQKFISESTTKTAKSIIRGVPSKDVPKSNQDLFFSNLAQCLYWPSDQYVNCTKSRIVARCMRGLSTSTPQDERDRRKVPRLILIQNPLTWLATKFDFVVLRSVWDPTFVEKEFRVGTKQAISRVTQLVSEGRYADLSGLLTRPARASLLRDLERTWTQHQRKLIALTNDDIQITSPRKVYFIRVADKKYCAVDMAFLALKWVSPNRGDGLAFVEIFARFHREYTAYSIPEWTIAYFKVTRFDILRKK